MANVCGIDKILRITGGAAVLALSFVGPFTETLFPWGLIAALPLVTGLIGWCPAYAIFGLKFCKG